MVRSRSVLTVGAVVAVLFVGALTATPVADDAVTSGAFADGPTGDGVTVAVVDTGIDDDHAALEGRVVDRVDLTDEGDDSGPDDGGDRTADPAAAGDGTDAAGDGSGSLDEHGHGTHVAGVVAGRAGGEDFDGGVAPGADLVDVRVLSDEGEGDADRIAEGIEYAVAEADADVVLLSLDVDGVDDAPIADRVDWATDRGTVVVASAGNSGTTRSITTPGTTPATITVGATAANGSVLSHSSRGPTDDGHLKPELLAPGERIPGPEAGTDDAHTTRTGTSMAAPQVAGAAALVLEEEPTLSPAAVESRLVSTARPLEGTDVYESGGGELDVERALDPDVVVRDAVVDFGLLEDDDRVSKTVTVENHGDRVRDLSLSADVENLDVETATDGTLSLNRSDLTLAPGESAAVELAVDGNATTGVHSGALEYAVDGERRTVPVGFVRGGTVTVEKRPLTAGDRVDGDPLFFFTEEGTHSGIQEFENGTSTFVAGGGTYVLWTHGVDRETGSIVLLSERIEVDGSERVVLAEADTSPVGVDAGRIVEEYGPLGNHTVAASMSTTVADGEAKQLSRTLLDAENRTVRVSEDPNNAVAVTYLLSTGNGGSGRLDAADVFMLHHAAPTAHWLSPVAVDPADLETTTYRFHRTTDDRSPEIQDRTTTDGVWNDPAKYWFDLGDREVQRVHRSTGGATHERHLQGDGWRAVLGADGDEPVDALEHPLIALVESVSAADGAATVETRPLADGSGTRFDPNANHSASVAVGERVVAERESDDPAITLDGVDLAAGDPVTVRVEGTNSDGRLSTRTHTEVRLDEYEPGVDARTPLVRDVDVVNATPANAAGPGEVTVTVAADDLRSLTNATVWYAPGERETPPWADSNGWERARTGYDDGRLTAALSVPEDADTVSLAAELETRDARVRTATANAFYAGAAPNTSTRTIGGRVLAADGTPAADDSVVATPAEGNATTVARTDADGRFELEVPNGETYDLQYHRGDPWSLNVSLGADRPAFASLGRVDVDGDVTVERTLPAAAPVTVDVVDERGDPVAGARVGLRHRAGNASVGAAGDTTDDGDLRAAPDGPPGIALGGRLELVVEPPEEGPYVDRTYGRSLTVNGSERAETVVLETRPPEANLETNRNWMLEGTPVTLDAGGGDVPAGVDEYRWDLTGDGDVDRVTEEPVVRYAPDPGETELTVTVVDRAGKTDSASRTVQVDPVG